MEIISPGFLPDWYILEKSPIEGSLISRNIRIQGRRTSVRLEAVMWDALQEIADTKGLTVHDVCSLVYCFKAEGGSFTSSLRSYLLKYYRRQAEKSWGAGHPS